MTATVLLPFKKVLSIVFFLSLILISASTVFAEDLPAGRQDSTSSGTRKEKVQVRMEAKTEKIAQRIENVREKMASREAALRVKLTTFKDQRKATIAERVNTNLNKINENQTSAMKKHLERMSATLDKLEVRVNSGKPDIKDPALARVAIASARDAIASASAAVSAQSTKDYTIEATTEANIKRDAQAKREQLHKDLRAVRAEVIAAKQSVASAIRTAKSGKLERVKEATESGE